MAPTRPSLNESQTRQQLIDQELARAGWGLEDRKLIEEYGLVASEEESLYGQSPQRFADYVLLGRNEKPLAVIEAKRTSRDALAGKRQAAEYADLIKTQLGIDPFIFLTNGEKILFWDRGRYPEREVSGFFTRTDLERLAHQKRYGEPLSRVESNSKIAGRDYQVEAIRRVTEAIESARRKFLLVMATGTGKTRTVIALIDLLLRAKRVQQVLFLADRRELVRQTTSEFKIHLPSENIGRIERGDIPRAARIHIATYPSMIQAFTQLSPGYYDLIIADESHRSIYNRYQGIFERFDALHVGLTATPTDFIDHNTFRLFGCEDGVPTFNYSFERAVADGNLVNYRVLEAQTNFQISGIQGEQLPLALQQQVTNEGVDIEEINFEGTDIERNVTNTGTNDAIAREFMEKCRKDALGLPAKSIIFAVSHAHAKRLYESFNRLFPDYQRRGLVEIIDSHMERADLLLDDFKFKDMPRVAISVDMLDTGVDVPAIQTLVFAKPVFSRVKFWQMVGRGTRLHTDPRTGEIKADFLIIDCWNNFAYFRLNPEGETDHPTEPLPVRLFRLRLEKRALLQGQGADDGRLTRALQAMLSALPSDNTNIRPHSEEIRSLLTTWPASEETSHRRLTQTIAPLLRYYWATSLVEIQFRILVERVAVAFLARRPREVERLAEQVREAITTLADSIQEVHAGAEKRAWVLSPGFWSHLDMARLDDLQETFAPLMRFRQVERHEIIELHLPDHIVSRRWVIYGPTGEGAFADSYREQVEAHVRNLADNLPALVKLKRGERLTDADMTAVARAFNQADLFITEDLLREVYQQPAASLPDFLRHILRLVTLPTWEERIQKEFDGFIAQHGFLSASQINFLRGVRAAVLRRAKLSRDHLTQPPFSRVGIAAVLFQPQEIDDILDFANRLVDQAA